MNVETASAVLMAALQRRGDALNLFREENRRCYRTSMPAEIVDTLEKARRDARDAAQALVEALRQEDGEL